MAHAQKPDFVFRPNGRVHLNRRGASVQSTTGSRGVRITVSNAGYTMFWGSVKGTGYTLHSPVSPSLPLPCVTVCHHVLTVLYLRKIHCHTRNPQQGLPVYIDRALNYLSGFPVLFRTASGYLVAVNWTWWCDLLTRV